MATISKVAIYNMALSHIGDRSRIESTDESSPAAQEADLWYDYSRIQTLEAHNWDFARTRVALALHAQAAPDLYWSFRYQWPAACVAAREIENPLGYLADPVPYEIELDSTLTAKTILTNADDAVLVYTADVETTALFSATFVQALSRFLASNICVALTGDAKVAAQQLQIAQAVAMQAAAIDANQSVQRKPREADAIIARA